MTSPKRSVASRRLVTHKAPTSCCSILTSQNSFRTLGRLTKPSAHWPDSLGQLPDREVENGRHNIGLEPSRQTVGANMSPRRAAQAARYTDSANSTSFLVLGAARTLGPDTHNRVSRLGGRTAALVLFGAAATRRGNSRRVRACFGAHRPRGIGALGVIQRQRARRWPGSNEAFIGARWPAQFVGRTR